MNRYLIVYKNGGDLSATTVVAENVVAAVMVSGIFAPDVVSVQMVNLGG